MSSRVSRLLVSAHMGCVHSISTTKYSWCLLLERVSVCAWEGMGLRDSRRRMGTPESLGPVCNRRQWAERASPTEPLWSAPSPVSGQQEGREKGEPEKPGGQSQACSVEGSQELLEQFRPPLIPFLFPSPTSRKTPLVTTQLRTKASSLHPCQGPSSFFRARKS